MDFTTYLNLLSTERQNYVVFFETFLVFSGCRPAAIIPLLESRPIIDFLTSNNFVVNPYFTGKNNFIIWKKDGKYHKENVQLYNMLEEMSSHFNLGKGPLEKDIQYFHRITGKLLGYLTPIALTNKLPVKGLTLQISFDIKPTLPKPFDSYDYYSYTSLVSKTNSLNWTSGNENTYIVDLMPQLVVDKTDEEIQEALKDCVAILNNTEVTKLLPVTIRGVNVHIRQTRGGSRNSRRSARRMRRQTRRRITWRT